MLIDKDILKQFHEWKNDGNVVKIDGCYSTQDAQYRNRLKDRQSLLQYFIKEFINV